MAKQPKEPVVAGPNSEWIGSSLLEEVNQRGWTPTAGETPDQMLPCSEGLLIFRAGSVYAVPATKAKKAKG